MSRGNRLDKMRPQIDRQVVEGIIVPLAFFIRDRAEPEPLEALQSRAELFRDIVDKMVTSGDPFSRTAEALKPLLRRSIEQTRPLVLEAFSYLAAPIESLKPTEVHRAPALLHMFETLLRPDLDEKALQAVEPKEFAVLAKSVTQQFRPTGIGAYDRQQSIGAHPVPVDLPTGLAAIGYHPHKENRLELFRKEVRELIETGTAPDLRKALDYLRRFRRAVEEQRVKRGLVDTETSPYVGEIWLKESGDMVGILSYDGPGFGEVPIEQMVRKPTGGNHADITTQLLLGHLPFMVSDASRIAVIAWGSGMTAGAILTHPVESVDAFEIEPAVIEASRYFEPSKYFKPGNGRPLDDERLNLVMGDARTRLQRSSIVYDLIVSEPSNPWITGVSNLFTQDFFEIASSNLKPDGILCQWFHLYGMSEESTRSLLATFRSVFPHTLAFKDRDLIFSVPRVRSAFLCRAYVECSQRVLLETVFRALKSTTQPTCWRRSVSTQTESRSSLGMRPSTPTTICCSSFQRRAVCTAIAARPFAQS